MLVLLLPEHRGAGERDAERAEAPGAGHVHRGVPHPSAERPGGQVSSHQLLHRLPLSKPLALLFRPHRGMLSLSYL